MHQIILLMISFREIWCPNWFFFCITGNPSQRMLLQLPYEGRHIILVKMFNNLLEGICQESTEWLVVSLVRVPVFSDRLTIAL